MKKNMNKNKKILVVSTLESINSDYSRNCNIVGISKILSEIYCNWKNDCQIYYWSNASLKGCNTIAGKVINVKNNNSRLFFKYGYKILYNWIAKGRKQGIKILKILQFEQILEKYSPVLINFHDLNDEIIDYVTLCLKRNIKCVVTLHIFIGKQDLPAYKKLKCLEEKFFEKNYPIWYVVVSKGVKKRLLQRYSKINSDQVTVISNGISIKETIHCEKDKDRERRILLCVGTICERKNQIQLVNAYHKLPNKIKRDYELDFVGNGEKKQSSLLLNRIVELGEEKNVFWLGGLTPRELSEKYKRTSFLINVSLNEAFGLTIIEAYALGIPCIVFKDIDAISELYDENAMMLIKGHLDEDIRDAIIKSVNKNWDKGYICQFAQNFSQNNMIYSYEKLYSSLLNGDEE